jgi:hypothetical protein
MVEYWNRSFTLDGYGQWLLSFACPLSSKKASVVPFSAHIVSSDHQASNSHSSWHIDQEEGPLLRSFWWVTKQIQKSDACSIATVRSGTEKNCWSGRDWQHVGPCAWPWSTSHRRTLVRLLVIDATSLTLFFVLLQAVAFVTFLVGFITVLCIGNYFRAKRAQERQRQRRLAKLAANNNGGYDGQGSYEAPAHLPVEGVHA